MSFSVCENIIVSILMSPSSKTVFTGIFATLDVYGMIIEAGGCLGTILASNFGFSASVSLVVSTKSLHSSISGYRARPILVLLSNLPFLVIARLCLIAVWRKPNFFTSKSSSCISISNGVYSLATGYSVSSSITY